MSPQWCGCASDDALREFLNGREPTAEAVKEYCVARVRAVVAEHERAKAPEGAAQAGVGAAFSAVPVTGAEDVERRALVRHFRSMTTSKEAARVMAENELAKRRARRGHRQAKRTSHSDV